MINSSFELVFTRHYSMAHRLIGNCSEKCRTPHGHNEVVTVKLASIKQAKLDQDINMIESFETAKKRWHSWIDTQVDHALQLNNQDPILEWFRNNEPQILPHLLITSGDPTTEMLAVCFMSKLGAFLKAEQSCLRCTEVSIQETQTNCVTFRGDSSIHLPEKSAWYARSDSSINDLLF